MGRNQLRPWLSSTLRRCRPSPIRRQPPAARLRLERCEERDVPSSSIPLNHFSPTDQPPAWVPMGPAPILRGGTAGNLNTSGRVSGIAADPLDPNRIFVAAATGGVWRTLNAAGSIADPNPTWTPLTDHLPDSAFPGGNSTGLRTLNMGAIAMSRSSPNIIYASEGEGDAGTGGNGILKSTDGGNTWTLLTNGGKFRGISTHSIVVDATNPNIVYFSSEGAGPGIWRTLDGGATWTNITAGAAAFTGVFSFTDVDVDPTNPDIVYASVGTPFGYNANGIYRTNNATQTATPTWTRLIGGSAQLPGISFGDIVMTISPTDPSTLYASIANHTVNTSGNNLLGVFRSNDSGQNWVKLLSIPDYLGANPPGQANYDNTIAV